METRDMSQRIKSIALDHKFLHAGISTVRSLDEEKSRLEDWLLKGYHGEMHYMAKNQSMRLNPAELVFGAKSVISLAYNYYRPVVVEEGKPKISIYAQGTDYHKVIKKKLKHLWQTIQTSLDVKATARYFVDSAPVMERQWAASAGLGWLGKNTLLIHPKHGSYFFLAEIICDLDLQPDIPIHDHCGTCTRCIDACPTEAIDSRGYVLKADQCISYLTIETKKDIPDTLTDKMENWVFGCDICQQVCPWNKFSTPHSEPLFFTQPDHANWTLDQWKNLSEDKFEEYFGKTPLKRAGYDKFKRSVKTVIDAG
ncbi:MAG: tRNA epoxyqueuosine(34) reductase QueG [Saprospiraceae bacterium]